MASRRRDEWEADSEVYTPAQIEAVINFCGLEVASETNTHFLAYCPFHHNTDSPAFAIDKVKGLWTCFNPACNSKGNLMMLLGRLKGLNFFQATRLINKHQAASRKSVTEILAENKVRKVDFVQFPVEPVEAMRDNFWQFQEPQDYMINQRGFDEETLKYFEIGYSTKQNMVIVPMHDPDGMLLGFVGRSIEGKVFKNSNHLPKSKTMWNLHRAKKHGETVVVVESSFCAMRVHQAGYKNVVALLGGHLSPAHVEQLGRNFSKIIIMTDYDPKQFPPNCPKCRGKKECEGHRPGRDLGRSIVNNLPHKKVMWAAYDDTCVFPHGAKDPSDMTDSEIRQCLRNAVSNFTYVQWSPEDAKEPVASSA